MATRLVPYRHPHQRGTMLCPVMKLAFLLGACVSPLFAAAASPNVLFILADDMGWNAPACYGNRDVATPHLDRLAAQGMRFTAAYADAQCSPTRAAFLSGQYGARTGVFKVLNEAEPTRAPLRPAAARAVLPPETATLARTLRAAGYATGISGKWHVADNYSVAPLRARDAGKYFDAYGFDFAGPANSAEHREDKTVTAVTDDIIGFIAANRTRPWFAFASHFTPHTPLEAPAALIANHVARGYKRSRDREGVSTERPTADYLAMLDHFDAETGRLLRRLDELGLADNTVVIFTSDNGGLSRVANNAPLREGKGSPYEGGIRVPLVIRWPGRIRAGSECAVPVHTVDFHPTFNALAGAPPPAGHPLDGENLLPLLRETGTLRRTALFWHMPTYTTNFGRTPCAVVRDGDWKLVHWFGDYLDTTGFTPDAKPYGKLVVGARTELFQLRDDPSEQRDLAAAQPAIVRRLESKLEAWWRDTGAALPAKNPAYDPADWAKIDPAKGRTAPQNPPKK